METVKNKSETNEELIIKEINETKDTLITVDRLDKGQFKHYSNLDFLLKIYQTSCKFQFFSLQSICLN